jgi:hypothetical protein
MVLKFNLEKAFFVREALLNVQEFGSLSIFTFFYELAKVAL